MEYSRRIKGTMDQCYDLLMESLLMDIHQHYDPNFKRESIKSGLMYEKKLSNKMGQSGVVSVEIITIDAPYVYEASFLSAHGINKLKYRCEPYDETQFELRYEEQYFTEKKTKKLNFSMMERLFRKKNTKRIELMFDQIELQMAQNFPQ